MSQKIAGLSVIIHTKNAAETLLPTLQSVVFADEIIVVDMHSSDKTLDIAKKFTDKIHSFKDVGYADPARNFGIEKAKGPWILVVDADEVVPKSLEEKIPELLVRESVSCYYLPRKNIIFNSWIEKTGWWPDYQARLFKKGHVSWDLGVHKQPIIDGDVVRLPATEENALVHTNYRSIKQFIEKLNIYTTITAQESLDMPSEKAAFKKQMSSFSSGVVKTFFNQFLQRMFAQKGLEDGAHGVSLSFLQSMYELVTLLKKWEIEGSQSTKNDEQAVLRELQQFRKDLAYWVADWQYHHTSGLEKYIWQMRRKFRW